MEFIDQQVEERRKTYQQELRPVLDKNLTRVREFWLRDVAPLTLGAQAGSQQAKDVVQRALGVPIDESQFAQFEHMLHKGATLVLARYITRYLKLPSSTVQYLLDSITPKKEVLIVNPMEYERRARKPEPASGNEAAE
ncbi:hypothetical protein [Ralstonia phage phiRSL1]|uniref:Uncharacterized protein n=1 Tax=Ralstonia phage phiRSL1 TaxID=1980924 RepID=B2ZYB7_9CAUD|nr:hypothetical protein RSL1_ORF218 [Ralstonia phage phiRSL1]BAG41667.1 hypothetical protein [Ralstonia phage phiRSL1]